MPACARMGDPHVCPREGHGLNAVAMGAPHTFFDGQYAACVGHRTLCGATIVVGFPKFTIDGLPVAYLGSPTSHGGMIVGGSPDIFAASMGGNPIDFQKMGAIDEDGELDRNKMDELLADPILETKAQLAGATVSLETQTFHFLDPVMSIFNRRAAEIPALSTTMARLSKQLKNEGHKHLDADQNEQGPPTKEEQDEDQLIVQVVGKEHNDDQRIAIFDECDNRLGKTEERTKEPFHYQTTRTEETGIDNELHIWPWPKNEPERVLKLEVQAENGDPIQLPLMDKAISTYKRTARQCNVICPIVPASLVENARPSQYSDSHIAESHSDRANNSVLAKARPGFFYIFINGRLWRELEIKQEEQEGKLTTYHDVRLSAYREGPAPDAPLKDEPKSSKFKREVVGKGLKDIWLPIQWNQRGQKVEVMFAEAQVPAVRLNRFERDPKLRKRRTQQIDRHIVEARVEHDKNKKNIILGHCMPKVRPRIPAMEWEFDFPAAYLLSLHGAHPYQAYKKAESYQLENMDRKKYHDHYLYVTKVDEGTGSDHLLAHRYAHNLKIRNYKPNEPHLESSALSFHIHESIHNIKPKLKDVSSQEQKNGSAEEDDNYAHEKGFWTNSSQLHISITDQQEAFYDVRTRKIGVIQVEDPLYRARLLRNRAIECKKLLDRLSKMASERPHYKSAVIMDRYLAPEKIGGYENPYYNDFKSTYSEGRRRIGYTLMKSERALVTKYLHEIQEGLYQWVQSHTHQYTLADLFSLSGVDYMGAFKLTFELIQWAGTPLHVLNNSDGDMQDRDSPRAMKWIHKLATTKTEPLHYMLYPDADLESLEQPYHVPERDENVGDGFFRAKEFAELMATPKYTDNPQTLDGLLLSGLESVNDPKFGQAKTFNAIMLQLNSNYGAIATQAIESVERVEERINKHLAKLKEVKADIDSNQAKYKGKEQEIYGYYEEIIKKEKRMLIDLHCNEAIRLRASIPDVYGEMRLMKRPVGQGFYVIGSFTPGSKVADRIVGELKLQDKKAGKNAKASSNVQKVDKSIMTDKTTVGVFAIPITAETTALLKEINTTFTDHVRLEKLIESLREKVSTLEVSGSRLQQLLKEAETEKAKIDQQIEEGKIFKSENLRIILPSFILSIEIWNLYWNEIQSFNGNVESKGESRARLGIAGAAIDTVIALEVIANKVSASNRISILFEKGIKVTARDWRRWLPGLSIELSKKMIDRFTVGTAFGAFSGGILLITNVMDAMYEWNRRNYGASVGFALIGLGAALQLASMMFAVQMGSTTLFASIPFVGASMNSAAAALGVGSTGPQAVLILASLALYVAGISVVTFFDSSHIELWIANGPFSFNPEASNVKHLSADEHESESYYRLLSLLVKPSIQIFPMEEENFDGPNALVRVTNPLQSLGTAVNGKKVNVVIQYSPCIPAKNYANRDTYHISRVCRSKTTYEPRVLAFNRFGDVSEHLVRVQPICDQGLCPQSSEMRKHRIDRLQVWAQAYFTAPNGRIETIPAPEPTTVREDIEIINIDHPSKEKAEPYWVRENEDQVRSALESFLKELESEVESIS